MSSSLPSFENDDRKFQEYLRANPGSTYAEYSVADQADKIQQGYVHASLGPEVQNHSDWWQAGLWAFRTFGDMAGVSSTDKVIEYGCGSLRVGAHFIKMLPKQHYVGLDITTDFINYGKEKIGQLFDEKSPYLDAISEESLSLAEKLGADIIYSPAVAFHVHPNDLPAYISNLKRLAWKKGSKVIFDTKISNKEWRYHETGWAYKGAFWAKHLYPMRLADFYNVKDVEEKGGKVSTTILVFQRD